VAEAEAAAPVAEPAALVETPAEPAPVTPPAAEPEEQPEPVEAGSPQGSAAAAPSGALSLVDVRRLWPDIVEATKLRRRVAWMHLTQNSQVVGVDGATLTLGFANAGARDSFVNGGCDEILRQAAIDIAGVDWKVETIVDPGASGGAQGAAPAAPPPPPEPPADEDAPATAPAPAPDASAAAREAIRTTRTAGPSEPATGDDPAASDADAHPDDPDADTSGLAGAELLQRELGAEVIEEIRHQ
jgi:DNA polymerase-3 subunit gamma/tau